MVTAIAMGVLIVSERGLEDRSGRETGKAPVTKPVPRSERPANETIDPREEFEAARNRGLTEQEVRWIVSDFTNLGIDSQDVAAGSAESYFVLRSRRHRWLVDVLASGFGLSADQKHQAAESIEALGERDLAEFTKYIGGISGFEVEGKEYRVVDGSKVRKLTDASAWMKSEDYAPWRLCDLTEEQKDLIRFRNEEGEAVWISGGSRTLDFGSDDRYEGSGDAFMTDPVVLNAAGWVFPLSISQVERVIAAKVDHEKKGRETKDGGSRLDSVRILAAPQLKTLLLLEPWIAARLTGEFGE